MSTYWGAFEAYDVAEEADRYADEGDGGGEPAYLADAPEPCDEDAREVDDE